MLSGTGLITPQQTSPGGWEASEARPFTYWPLGKIVLCAGCVIAFTGGKLTER